MKNINNIIILVVALVSAIHAKAFWGGGSLGNTVIKIHSDGRFQMMANGRVSVRHPQRILIT